MSFSSSSLKLIAAGTMLADHVGLLFFPDDIGWRLLGRLSFPLFAFLIAEGYRHTRSVERYSLRLGMLAFVSQAPYTLMLFAGGMPDVALNVFFTLLAGLLAIALIDRFPPTQSVPIVLVILAAAELLSFDYGAYGVLLILASFLFLTHRGRGALALAVLSIAESSVLLPDSLSIQFFAPLAIPFLYAYNGAVGARIPRVLFYWFYPVHILVLVFLWYLMHW